MQLIQKVINKFEKNNYLVVFSEFYTKKTQFFSY